ncbi:hypothetical protein SY88_14535 [Clostridiales bacterium PH28_bin88]|nr:hypothetical protein SY88_14535 [Clostridiales bacterium PH28_bin88]
MTEATISCQVSFYPLSSSDYRQAVETLLAQWDLKEVQSEVGLMSTTLIGPAGLVWEKLRTLYDLAEGKGIKFVMNISISNSCLDSCGIKGS